MTLFYFFILNSYMLSFSFFYLNNWRSFFLFFEKICINRIPFLPFFTDAQLLSRLYTPLLLTFFKINQQHLYLFLHTLKLMNTSAVYLNWYVLFFLEKTNINIIYFFTKQLNLNTLLFFKQKSLLICGLVDNINWLKFYDIFLYVTTLSKFQQTLLFYFFFYFFLKITQTQIKNIFIYFLKLYKFYFLLKQ